MNRGHTKGFLRNQLGQRGIFARSSLGQCFLVDLNLLDLIIEQSEISTADFVLEVGTGTGSLTRRLAEKAGFVLSIEIDAGLFELAGETLRDYSNIQLLNVDILQRKNALNPKVLNATSESLTSKTLSNAKLIANLPYNVATPIITLLLLSDKLWDRFVVTVQQELADRLVAEPGTSEYGSLAVFVQAVADVKRVRELSPKVFWPKPKVSSTILVIRPNRRKRADIEDLKWFHQFVRGLMVHRRKNLRNALGCALPKASKSVIHKLLADLSLDPRCRAELLDVRQLIELAQLAPQELRLGN